VTFADLVLLPARVFTADPAQPFAAALAVAGERVVAVGDAAAIAALAGPATTVVRLPGALAVPGFNDAHVHMLEGGESLAGLDLRDARDEEEVRARVAAHARTLAPGEWILHGGWDHEKWPSRAWPARGLIDEASAGHPAVITRVDGHLGLANTAALARAGITRATPDPPGGTIVRDAAGEPTGIVIDTALERFLPLIAAATGPAARRRHLTAALAHAARLGVTSVQDNVEPATWDVYAALRAEGRLTARVSGWYPLAERARLREEGVVAGTGDAWLRRGTVKLFADGSMGAGSAWFFAPYNDEARLRPASGNDAPGTGLALHSEEELRALVADADAAGLTVACHAIGDRANAATLDAFAAAAAGNPPRPRRHRVEHVQAVRPEDLPRYRQLGLVASLQPSHALDDQPWLEKRLGAARGATVHRLRSLLATGAAVAFGTDWYVAPLDPRRTLYAAVVRARPEDGAAWHPEEAVTLAEALTAYTSGSAFAEGQERDKGRLAPGALADIAVFARDLFTVAPREWLETPVVLTVVGGRIVHRTA
jgi:predicted amidohydrolase YtcJ